MSQYTFIAADYELPEISNSKVEMITVKEAMERGVEAHELVPWEELDPTEEVMYFKEEDDLNELEIYQETDRFDDIDWKTAKPFIYVVDFVYTEQRGQELIDYLQENLKEGYTLELWTIWLDEEHSVKPKTIRKEYLSLKEIARLTDFNDEDFEHHQGIIIK